MPSVDTSVAVATPDATAQRDEGEEQERRQRRHRRAGDEGTRSRA